MPPKQLPEDLWASRDWDRQVALQKTKQNTSPQRGSKKEKVQKNDWWQDILSFGKMLLPHAIGLLTGMGDYRNEELITEAEQPITNSLLAAATNGKLGSQVPVMHESGNVVRVSHREYLGDVYSSTTSYSLQTFNINPGLNGTFPWLAPIANQFTAWKPLGIVAEFVSEGSDYANVAGLGYVALASNYNALAAPYNTKRELLNSQFATAAKPSITFQHWIECKDDNIPQEKLYVRSGQISQGDLRLYDLSVLYLAVGGNTASGAIIGELWVTYDILLMLPKATETAGINDKFYFGQASNTQNSALFTGMASFAGTNVGLTFAANIITVPSGVAGYFLLTVRYSSNSALSITVPNLSYTGGVSQSGTIIASGAGTYTDSWQMIPLFCNGQTGTIVFSTASVINPPGTTIVWFNQRPAPVTDHFDGTFDPLGKHYEEKLNSLLKQIDSSESDWRLYTQTPKFCIESNNSGEYRLLCSDLPEVGLLPFPSDLIPLIDKITDTEKDLIISRYLTQVRDRDVGPSSERPYKQGFPAF